MNFTLCVPRWWLVKRYPTLTPLRTFLLMWFVHFSFAYRKNLPPGLRRGFTIQLVCPWVSFRFLWKDFSYETDCLLSQCEIGYKDCAGWQYQEGEIWHKIWKHWEWLRQSH